MEKDHPGWKHLNASLRDKVEILAKNPYRFYIYPNVWTFRGATRLEILSKFLTEAEAAEDFERLTKLSAPRSMEHWSLLRKIDQR